MRTDRDSWDQVFMSLAASIARRSRDPKAQVGAAVRAADNRVLSVGYNGPPRTAIDDRVPWVGLGKQPWMVHAEFNALLFAVAAEGSTDLEGATLYCTGKPCPDCARFAAHVGVRSVVHGISPEDRWELAQSILRDCGVEIRHYVEERL